MSDVAPDEKKKVGAKGYGMTLNAEDIEHIDAISEHPTFKPFKPSRHLIVSVALEKYRDMLKGVGLPVSKADLDIAVAQIIEAVGTGGGKAGGGGKVGRPARLTPEQEQERGREICTLLEGREAAGTCFYMKREISAIGRAVEYEVGEPLEKLTEAHVENQYDPNKSAWLSAKARDEA